MKETIIELKELLKGVEEYMENADSQDMEIKPAPNKWSKREILGHLIDSAINNLQRFTEAQYKSSPYIIRRYDQDDLVRINRYQGVEHDLLLKMWLALNLQIIHAMKNVSDEVLAYKVIIPEGKNRDLRWLFLDYVDHMKHHLSQIMNQK